MILMRNMIEINMYLWILLITIEYNIGCILGETHINGQTGHLHGTEASGQIQVGATSGHMPTFTTSGQIPANAFSGQTPVNGSSEQIPPNETSEQIQTNETSEQIQIHVTSEELPASVTSAQLPANGTIGKIQENATSGQISANETSGQIQTNATNCQISANETSGQISNDTFGEMLNKETIDPIATNGSTLQLVTNKSTGNMLTNETTDEILNKDTKIQSTQEINGDLLQNVTAANDTVDKSLHNSSIELISLNTTGSNVIVGNQIIVVDFRQWYRYGYEIILYGYVMPVWSVINFAVYFLMVVVFLKSGITSTTQVCLVAMAICDGVNPIPPSIIWLYIYVIRKHIYFLPLEWCRNFYYLTEVIPQIIVYISMLLTILLAIQRCIVVMVPFKAERLVSKRRVIIGIAFCIAISVAARIIYFFHYDFFGITVPAFNQPNDTMEACAVQKPQWLHVPLLKYLAIMQVAQISTSVFIPCVILVVAEILLVIALIRNRNRRRSLSLNNMRNEKREKLLTELTIAITGIKVSYLVLVLTVQGIDFMYLFFDISVVHPSDLRSVVAISNTIFWVFIVPSNFIITCCLSTDFRNELKTLFCISSETIQNTET